MDPFADPPSTTLRGLEQTIVALPYQLGYHPQDSLVLLCLDGRAGGADAVASRVGERVALTARIDLPPAREHVASVAALDPALRRPETHAVVAVLFEDASAAESNVPAMVAALCARADRWGVEIRALATVSEGRWRRVSRGGHPGPWQPLPSARDVPAVAEYVAAGRAPVRDRRAVEELLRPNDPALAQEVEHALRDRSTYGCPGDVGLVTPERAEVVAALFGRLAAAGDAVSPPLPVTDLAQCVSALHDTPLRDTVLSRLTGLPWAPCDGPPFLRHAVDRHLAGEAVLRRVTAVQLACAAAYAPRRWAAPWLTVTGLVAWHVGDGALANIAIEAALRSDSGYSLARLMDLTLTNAVCPPSVRGNHGDAGCV